MRPASLDFHALEVIDLRGVDEARGLRCSLCCVLMRGPTVLVDCAFDRCDVLVEWGKYLTPAALPGPTNPLQAGSTVRRLLAHQMPRDLPALF